MSKEFECLDRIDKRKYLTEREHKEFLGVVEKAIKEYEAINNAEPSEALECLEYIENKLKDLEYIAKQNDNEYLLSKYIPSEKFDTIKQALLKAQEPKHYLKWEDLDFKEKGQWLEVKMGDNLYTMSYSLYKNGVIRLEYRQRICLELFADRKQFFNDLHLERVEE